MHHELKIRYEFWVPLIVWLKTHELRYNDRDYKEWDTISFIEVITIGNDVEPSWYLCQKFIITHVLPCSVVMPNSENWVILSLKKI